MNESSDIGSEIVTPPDDSPPQRHERVPRARAALPAVLAVVFFVAFSALVLSRPEKMIEPDPYAYRASIAALEQGDLTLDQSQYDALSRQLQMTELGGGIMQWRQNADGMWVSEKNPGYPFLAVGFDEVGALRLAPLVYGALACLAMWFGARRWLGRWGGTFAVGAYCSTALAMVMAWRSTMPTFTDASLVAAGLGLLIWSVVALERSHRARTVVGSLAFLSFGLAVFVRYTNIVVLAVAALFALVICLRSQWRLGWSTLVWWALAAIPPLIACLAYNAMVFEGPFSTGYKASTVQFSTGAIPDNLRLMPGRLWQAMPVFVVGLLAVVVLLIVQLIDAFGRRSNVAPSGQDDPTTSTEESVPDPASVAVRDEETSPPSSVVDRWVAALLVVSWAAIWATYAAYEWTTMMGSGPRPLGATIGGNMGGAMGGAIGGAMGGSTQTVYSTVRFYLPALGAIALLVAWLLTRMPALIGVVLLAALFVFGAHEFLDTTNGRWASSPMGGDRSGSFGPTGSVNQPGTPGAMDPNGSTPPTPPNGQVGPGGMPRGPGGGGVPSSITPSTTVRATP